MRVRQYDAARIEMKRRRRGVQQNWSWTRVLLNIDDQYGGIKGDNTVFSWQPANSLQPQSRRILRPPLQYPSQTIRYDGYESDYGRS